MNSNLYRKPSRTNINLSEREKHELCDFWPEFIYRYYPVWMTRNRPDWVRDHDPVFYKIFHNADTLKERKKKKAR